MISDFCTATLQHENLHISFHSVDSVLLRFAYFFFLFNLTLLCSSSPHDCVIFHCKNLELVPDQMIYVLVMKTFFCVKTVPLECQKFWWGQAYILSKVGNKWVMTSGRMWLDL